MPGWGTSQMHPPAPTKCACTQSSLPTLQGRSTRQLPCSFPPALLTKPKLMHSGLPSWLRNASCRASWPGLRCCTSTASCCWAVRPHRPGRSTEPCVHELVGLGVLRSVCAASGMTPSRSQRRHPWPRCCFTAVAMRTSCIWRRLRLWPSRWQGPCCREQGREVYLPLMQVLVRGWGGHCWCSSMPRKVIRNMLLTLPRWPA
mmetsp:Transcript_37789/g.84276  ORF Transcript_37789/g.84276 Transcript_37789/m.84276 type:complete len:202 (+) Transcript_37789:1629-2234(+)